MAVLANLPCFLSCLKRENVTKRDAPLPSGTSAHWQPKSSSPFPPVLKHFIYSYTISRLFIILSSAQLAVWLNETTISSFFFFFKLLFSEMFHFHIVTRRNLVCYSYNSSWCFLFLVREGTSTFFFFFKVSCKHIFRLVLFVFSVFIWHIVHFWVFSCWVECFSCF